MWEEEAIDGPSGPGGRVGERHFDFPFEENGLNVLVDSLDRVDSPEHQNHQRVFVQLVDALLVVLVGVVNVDQLAGLVFRHLVDLANGDQLEAAVGQRRKLIAKLVIGGAVLAAEYFVERDGDGSGSVRTGNDQASGLLATFGKRFEPADGLPRQGLDLRIRAHQITKRADHLRLKDSFK